jgi:hypothetical protein
MRHENRTDHDAIGFRRVEHEMRLEAETTISDAQFVNDMTDAGKVREQPEGAVQPRKIGFGLILAKSRFGEIVDSNQSRLGGSRKPETSHDVVWPTSDARQLKRRSSWRR